MILEHFETQERVTREVWCMTGHGTNEVVILDQAAVRDSFMQHTDYKLKRGPEQHARRGVAQSNRPMPWHIPDVLL